MLEMCKEIVAVFDEYARERKLADRDYVQRIIDIITRYDMTRQFLEKVDFSIAMDATDFGRYSYFYKKLDLSEEILSPSKKDNLSELLTWNAHIISILLHECTHMAQFNNFISCNGLMSEMLKYTSIEHAILRRKLSADGDLTDLIGLISSGIITAKDLHKFIGLNVIFEGGVLYDISPEERMANIRSLRLLKVILGLSEFVDKKMLNEDFSAKLSELKKSGYVVDGDQVLSPSERYFNELEGIGIEGATEHFRDKVLSRRIPLSRRITYGLPLTKEEYDNIK